MSVESVYIVTTQCRAPRIGAPSVIKQYRSGDELIGVEVHPNGIAVIRDNEGHIVSKECTRLLRPSASAQRELNASAAQNDNLKNAKSVSNKSPVSHIANMASASTKGAIYGLVIGFGFAALSGRNKIIYSALGGLSGGMIGAGINRIKSKKK